MAFFPFGKQPVVVDERKSETTDEISILTDELNSIKLKVQAAWRQHSEMVENHHEEVENLRTNYNVVEDKLRKKIGDLNQTYFTQNEKLYSDFMTKKVKLESELSALQAEIDAKKQALVEVKKSQDLMADSWTRMLSAKDMEIATIRKATDHIIDTKTAAFTQIIREKNDEIERLVAIIRLFNLNQNKPETNDAESA